MTTLFEKHLALVQEVNNATTQDAHARAFNRLSGFREALDYIQPHPEHLIACDNYYLDQGIDRPMCCGVWLDWMPTKEEK